MTSFKWMMGCIRVNGGGHMTCHMLQGHMGLVTRVHAMGKD